MATNHGFCISTTGKPVWNGNSMTFQSIDKRVKQKNKSIDWFCRSTRSKIHQSYLQLDVTCTTVEGLGNATDPVEIIGLKLNNVQLMRTPSATESHLQLTGGNVFQKRLKESMQHNTLFLSSSGECRMKLNSQKRNDKIFIIIHIHGPNSVHMTWIEHRQIKTIQFRIIFE